MLGRPSAEPEDPDVAPPRPPRQPKTTAARLQIVGGTGRRTSAIAALAGALAALISGCGHATPAASRHDARPSSPTTSPTTSPTGRVATAGNSHGRRKLGLVVAPRTARAGAEVAIKVTGCAEARRRDVLTYTDHYLTPRRIKVTRTGSSLAARFTVPDTGLRHATITAQCEGSRVVRPFTVAGRTSTLGLVLTRTVVAHGYRILMVPARHTPAESYVAIPGRAASTYVIPRSWVPKAFLLSGPIVVTTDGTRLTALEIVGG